MTTAGHTKPSHGTRFEFVLVDSSGDRARYDCAVLRDSAEWSVTIELANSEVQLVAEPAGLPEDARAQLVSLARVLAKHASDEPWPRRVLRWRQPGVR
ncbi:MAG: hypothetical protein JNK05_27205 [Myxococcales bacterium]|nr:hypothetical protein [Myxococcales bacterium]